MNTQLRNTFIPQGEGRIVLGIAVLAIVLRVFFWGYVDRVWEDGLITILHAENFWRGLGLTHFHNGQGPVHGFTSPISVLVPWIGEALGSGWGLRFFRFASTIASAAAVAYTYALCRHPVIGLPVALGAMASAYVAVEYHQILWGMSGLEAQLVALVLLMSCYHFCNRSARDLRILSVLLGVCMLARPDMLFWCVIVGAGVLVRSRRDFAKLVAIGALVYVPWLVFAQLYYGSFIPNTIHAKEAAFGGYPLPHSLADLLRWDKAQSVIAALGPSFAGYGTGYQYFADGGWISIAVVLLSLVGAVVLLRRRESAGIAIALFFLVYLAYYLYLVPIVFGWYLVPLCAVGVVLACVGLFSFRSLLPGRQDDWVVKLLAAAYVLVIAAALPLQFRTERHIQRYIEDDVRKAMGLYLREAMRVEQTVSLEPLGYVSYYSGRDVYDTPGLANPRVVDFYKSLPRPERTLYNLVRHFYPDFVVLRPGELSMEYGYFRAQPWFRAFYGSDRAFQADPDKLRRMWRSSASYDTKFVVFRRRAIVGSIAADGWLASPGWALAHGDAGAPPQPHKPAYVLRLTSGAEAITSKPFTGRVPAGIVFFVRAPGADQRLQAEIITRDGRILATRSLLATRDWAPLNLDAARVEMGTPVMLRLRAVNGGTVEIAQPFLLDAFERVGEFRPLPATGLQRWESADFTPRGRAWAPGGVFDQSSMPPDDQVEYVYGSFARGDAGKGMVTSNTVRVTEPGMKLRLYITSGPDTTGQRLGLDTDGDGLIDVDIERLRAGGWQKVDLDLSSYAGRDLQLIAIDDGSGWGQWSGFSQPLLFRP